MRNEVDIKWYWDVVQESNHLGALSGCKYEETIKFLQISDLLKPNDKVLEVGVGLGMTFMELCEWYEITDIHYLQIDTEGYDAEIIKSIDFAKVNIDIIKYEQ